MSDRPGKLHPLAASRAASASSRVAAQSPHLRSFILSMPLIGATYISKLSVPPFSKSGINLTLPLILGVMILGCLTNQFRVAPARLALFAVVLGVLGVPQLLANDPYSISSVILLVALHVPFVVCLRPDERNVAPQATSFFLKVAMVIACCAIAQFFLQFVINIKFLFPIENFIPEAFRVHNYNNEAPLSYGSHIYRSNGLFMLEPSYLSQFIAVAVVVELCGRNRWWLLGMFGAALLVSYSGTGLIILAVCVPLVVIAKRRWDFLVLMLFLLALIAAFAQQLYLDSLLSRSHELGSTGSSGFARFVGGFYMFDQFLWNHPWRTLFGYGAGSFKDYLQLSHYAVAEMPLFKMVFEYGLVGAALFFTFLFYCLFSSSLPRLVALAVSLTFLLNGLYMPFAHGIALTLLIWQASAPRERWVAAQRVQERTQRPGEFREPNAFLYRSR